MLCKALRYISFGGIALIIPALAAATAFEKTGGTAGAFAYFYHSPWLLTLWAITAVSAAAYLFLRRRRLNRPAMLLHLSFLVILAGAAVSFVSSARGLMVLAEDGPPQSSFIGDDEKLYRMPFSISLVSCSTQYYPGTTSPMDYSSVLSVCHGSDAAEMTVSMNNILEVDGYRFYQTDIGDRFSVLTVVWDPWGIALTYTGYTLLFISICLFFFSRHSRFRDLLRKVSAAVLMLVPVFCHASGDATPRTLPRPVAENFGHLYAFGQGRVVPLQTVARDFCLKLTGKDSYRGLSAEQVLAGWIFYPDDWKSEPMIKVKGDRVKSLLGIGSDRTSLLDFYKDGTYALGGIRFRSASDKDISSADEKVSLISQMIDGRALRIIPVNTSDYEPGWYSPADTLQTGVMSDKWHALVKSIRERRYARADSLIASIRASQISMAGRDRLPSDFRIGAERLYNRVSYPWARAFLLLGAAIAAMIFRRRRHVAAILAAVSLAALSFLLGLRWIVGCHIPMSNGYETMQTMAWLSLATGLALSRRLPVLTPLALLVAALSLIVAAMGESNPAVSPLMPVLASPWLSVHVMLVMLAYALFTMMALNSLASLLCRGNHLRQSRLADLSTLLLYPAVFALAAGIFTGAVWANQSWGRYWGWDPKETWALITLLIYAIPLHSASIPAFARPRVLNIYYLVAFLSVVITFFGVNYLLSGMHSYAG